MNTAKLWLLMVVPAGMAFGAGTHPLPEPKHGGVVVGLCDGETSLEVEGSKAGQPLTEQQAREASQRLMAEWKKKHPNEKWEDAPKMIAAAEVKPNAGPGAAAKPEAQQSGHTYGAYTERDEKVWKASTDTFVAEGKRIFHDAKALGGTVAISCDMCHPDAANTHPETYPKFQVQLGRVAMLRDMINWCIENPVRGTPIAEDSAQMKALEAYIYASRKGTALDYGKH